jgi:rhodanese-related sulfurtransferase/transglutaminase-like putative cysteine protease
MKKTITVLLFAAFFLTATQVAAATVAGIIEMDFDLSHQPLGQEARLWIPYPVTDANQNIGKVGISGNFTESGVYTDAVFKTPMLYARWDKAATARQLSFSFQAERDEVVRRDFPSREAAWDPADYALYLGPTRLGPLDGEVRKLADRITKGKHGVLAKARAIYDWTVDNTYRDPDTRGCGVGDVFRLLREPGGKCADISSIYVALARGAGVPAREVFGIRMGKTASQEITTWQHCWAEFYLPGYGWVPVDPADVRKMMLAKNLDLTAPETKEYRRYFMGGVDPYRIKLGEGRDLRLNPPQAGEPVNYLMYPFAQIGATTLDWLDPANFKYTITHHQLGEEGYGLIDTDTLKQMLDAGTPMTVIDARNPEEYQEVHIRGALSIPVKQWARYADRLPIDKSAKIIFYCNGVKCGKSKKAAIKAMAGGYDNVFVYAEGMPVWEEKGLPIYAGPDYEKRVATTIIAPADLSVLLPGGKEKITIVDVRDPEEFQAGHIPGAINMPVATFAAQSGTLAKQEKIVVYCNSGGRSYNAYRKLMKLGYTEIYQAIFADWQAAGLPFVTD